MADDNEEGKDDYEVGYAKPPKQHQFQKGQSGNPSGRSKGARNLKTIIDDVFSEPVRLRREGSVTEVPMVEAILRSMASKAAKGDVAAFRALQPHFAAAGLTASLDEESLVTPEEEAVLMRFLARIEREQS